MTVGFYHVVMDSRKPSVLAERMIRSVRAAMPGVPVVQFTDILSPKVPGVDVVVVRERLPVSVGTLEAFASVDGEWLFLDTDAIVREDVRSIFDQPFDIAVADREGTLLQKEVGTKLMRSMPYNKGAVFSRCQAFWQAAHRRCLELKPARQVWMGDQQAMNDVIATGTFSVAVLPSRYNYPPKSASDPVGDKAIVHYKGKNRKLWMVAA